MCGKDRMVKVGGNGKGLDKERKDIRKIISKEDMNIWNDGEKMGINWR